MAVTSSANKILLMLAILSPISNATNGARITLFYSKTVGIPGDQFDFICSYQSHTALNVQWLVNRTLLENSSLEIVLQEYSNISKRANLHFNLPLEHNVTTIQCIVNFASENVSSETITLLLQGLLSAVGSPSVDLVGTDISITWSAPFTLDISDVDPDITYCVDVVNSTSSSTVLSECGITVTGFNFSIPIGRVCDNLNFSFTVTPVNRAGNGTAATLGYSQDITAPRVKEKSLIPISEVIYLITMSAPVCDGELTVINDNTGDETHIQGNDLNITMNIIMFTSENLKDNQFYTISVNASNINGSAVSYVSLSTHDVMNTTFNVTSHTITTEYFEYSTALGALYIFIFINEDRSIDFKKSIYLPLDRNSSHKYTLPNIPPGQYQMSVYDIESDGTLNDEVVYSASRDQFTIAGNSQGSGSSDQVTSSKEIKNCNVTYVDDIISAMCSYSNGSSVTGFEMIVQLNNIDEVHKLYINGTTEHQSPGPVTVRVEKNGTYQVAIFPIFSDRGVMNTIIAYSRVLSDTEPQTMIPETESSDEWITAVGVVVPLLVLIIITGIGIGIGIGIGCRHYRKPKKLYFEKRNDITIENVSKYSDSGISSTTTSTPKSISRHTTSAQCTESESNHGREECKPECHVVKQALKDESYQQQVDSEPKHEDQIYRQDLGENDGFRHLYDAEDSISTVETLQDCGSFISQCGLSQDPSSSMATAKTYSTGNTLVTGIHDVKSSHIALKPATNIFNDSNVKLVYLETKSLPDMTCSINDDVWKSNSEMSCAISVDTAKNNLSRSEVQKDRKVVGNSQCSILNECVAIHEKAVQNQNKVLDGSAHKGKQTDNQLANKKFAPSSPADGKKFPSLRESPHQEIPSPKFTDKEKVPTLYKSGVIDWRATILLMLVVLLRASTATNSVHLFSLKTVTTPGDECRFHCVDTSFNALSIQWLVNGTLLENSTLVIVIQQYSNTSKTADLFFNLHLKDNGTTIQCVVNFPTKNVSSETITLLLQGTLQAVGSPSVDLADTNISITWTAPFTLDVSNVDPDITYCVDVVNSTSSSRVLSECGITVTGFNFSIPIGRVCDNYTFTVTPVNGAGNGTAVTLGYAQDPLANEELLLPTSESTYQITMSAPVCDGELTVINDNTGDETHIQGCDLNITMNVIMFTSEKLKENQLYTVSVNASNINGSAVSYVSLSTHDVMNATFDVTSHTITTEYFEYSTAMGALYIFIFINDDGSIDFKKSIYLSLDRSSSHNYTLPDISPGQYQMFVYDIDSGGKLHDGLGYSANRDQFTIAGNSQGSSDQVISSKEIKSCSVTYVDDVISAMCSYSNGSSVTGFQMIVQLSNVTEVYKLHINGTTEHLSLGPVTVRVEENETYHVAIFPILSDRGIMNTTIAYSQLLSATDPQTMITETSKESSHGWIAGVVVVLLIQIIIIGTVAGIGYRKMSKNSLVIKNFNFEGGDAGSNIINGPTITGISSLPINMMTISIESNIGAPDADIFISATDSTAQSIPTSAASIHSTESENNPGGRKFNPGLNTVNHSLEDQQEVDNDVQSMDCNTGQSKKERKKEANSQQSLNLIIENTVGSNTVGAVGSSTEGTVGTNTEDAVGFNTSSPLSTISAHSTESESNHGREEYKPECDISKQALEDMSYQQQVDNTQQNINCSISQSMEEENGEVNNQQTLNPNTDGFMGANSEKSISPLTKDDLQSILDSVIKCHSQGKVFAQDQKASNFHKVDGLESVITDWSELEPHIWKYLVTAAKKGDSVVCKNIRRHTFSTNENMVTNSLPVVHHNLRRHTFSTNEHSGLGAVNSDPSAIPRKQKHKISTTEPLDKCDFGAEHGQVPSDVFSGKGGLLVPLVGNSL